MSQSASIISLANALYAPPSSSSSSSQKSQHDEDRLDAARALLGVSPSSVAEPFGGRAMSEKQPTATESTTTTTENDIPPPTTRSRSDSVGLDALAFCANEQVSLEVSNVAPPPPPAAVEPPVVVPVVPSCLSSSDEDSDSMPPPPPRMVTRRRSVSNPEGMERWGAPKSHRLHLVLPASILEEELAEANAAMKAKEEDSNDMETEDDSAEEEEEELGTNQEEGKDNDDDGEEEEEEEELLDQDELLRRARSRLLEDLSQGNLNGDKGVLILPQSLEKYKKVRFLVFLFKKRCDDCIVDYSRQAFGCSSYDLCFCFNSIIMHISWYIKCRFIIRMDALAYTHPPREQRSSVDFRARGVAGFGTRKFDTTAGRT